MTGTAIRKKTAAEDALARAFARDSAALAGGAETQKLRKDGFGAFERLGVPTRRNEAWHYSDLRAAIGDGLPFASAPDAQALAAVRKALTPVGAHAIRIVLVDGYYCDELSALPGDGNITVRSLDDALGAPPPGFVHTLAGSAIAQGDAMVALNAAFMRGGVVIDVEPGYVAAAPVEIIFATAPGAPRSIVTRSLIRAGAKSKVSILEHYLPLCSGTVHSNEALVVRVGDGARIDHAALFERAGNNQVAVRSLLTQLRDDAQFASHALVEGGGFLRQQIFALFEARNALLSLCGASLLRGSDHADTTLVADHAQPDNTSREFFKHIVDGQGTGVFQGKVIVAPDAQKTDGVMKSQTILLGERSAMYNKPELEIFADDVTCGHGATVGALDANQLFYAMSRGLPRAEAEGLLLEGFAAEAFEGMADDALRQVLTDRIRHWLAQRSAA